jgi:hypothetical protein
MINSVKLTRFNADADDICVSATPEAMAFLLLPGQRTGLREVSPGKYCSRLRLAEFPANAMSMASVEVRSPYGSSAREPLKKTFESCSLKGLLRVADNARMKTLVIACTQTAHTSPVIKEGCDNGIQRCGDRKFLIYRAASTLGPFTKVAEVQDLRWAIPKPQGKDGSLYQVVAVDKNGNFSVPEAVEIEQSSATGNS